jgi:hypothetical protein
MSGDKGSDDPPERENLAGLWTAQDVSVTEAKSEPPSVALARLKYENIRFLVVAVGALGIALLTAGFLMNGYSSAKPEDQTRILTILATLATGAFGAFVGRVSAK